jgi:rod shape-determining protein MreC
MIKSVNKNVSQYFVLFVVSILLIISSFLGLFKKFPLLDIFTLPTGNFVTDIKISVNSVFSKFEQNEILVKENLSLKKEIQEKDIELEKSLLFSQDFESLKKINNIQQKKQNLIQTHSISKNFYQKLPQEIIIDKGEKEGVKKDAIVINDTGTLVGRIDSVSQYTARILPYYLETDFKVPVKSVNTQTSFIDGSKDGLISGQEINTTSLHNINDLLFTNALDNKIPEGIYIGKVVKFETDDKRRFLIEADLQNIDILYVIV